MNTLQDGFCDHVKTIADDVDKLVDELAKGKKMEKILRTAE